MSRPKTLEEQVNELIVELFGQDEANVTANANLRDDLGFDSLDVVELCMSMEDAFDISVNDEDGEGLETVEDVYELVQKKTS